MIKKKVDSRIRTLIENGVAQNHRSLFVVIGDHGKDQVVNLHYMLTKATVKQRPSVLWCYKNDLGFTTHRQKRMRKIQKDIKRGLRQADSESPFELFVAATDIRYCYYKETHRILGNTYGMLVLQDFSSITPNILARTIETIEGGGIVVLLIQSLQSLKQLYGMAMDVHARYRTESALSGDVVGRFNERFMLSLTHCKSCIVVDDELNILPISSHIKDIVKVNADDDMNSDTAVTSSSATSRELVELKDSLRDTPPIGQLVSECRTLDQARAVLTFVEAISEKTLRSTVALTAARGRGKSAALGLSIAAAVSYGYSNIFVTSPSPENLKTLFEMVFKGFDALEYREHTDYEVVASTNPEMNKAVVRVNIYHTHRQTILYIAPHDYPRLAQAELLVIDEAAAIPLPVVRNLLGPYLVFMSSTINGYEGTGRSLSLKLLKQLRQQSAASSASSTSLTPATNSSRVLREITLDEPIRYSLGDTVERWLNDLLCLDCTSSVPRLLGGIAHPSECDLYYVDRDTLFSHHQAAELFLQRMMSLYVSSHYKNTPNDLQLLSDAPAHHLFVLLGPMKHHNNADDSTSTELPDILAVIQVCLEGAISKQSVARAQSRGQRASGDLIPWTISQQFQASEFAQLSGARVVRIATHPDLPRMGYATRALDLLHLYYDGQITSINEDVIDSDQYEHMNRVTTDNNTQLSTNNKDNLLSELITPRQNLPPLLLSLSDRPAERLHYIGVSYGLTQELYNFWSKSNYVPVYLRQTSNELTGEHTCIMIHTLKNSAAQLLSDGGEQWLELFYHDFRKRFMSLLGYEFATFPASLALSVLLDKQHQQQSTAATVELLDDDNNTPAAKSTKHIAYHDLTHYGLDVHDLRRLDSYAKNLVDYHMIVDLLPILARLYFLHSFNFTLTYTQSAIFIALGFQHKTITQLETELGIGSQQILAQFFKIIRKVNNYIVQSQQEEAAAEVDAERSTKGTAAASLPQPVNVTLDAELKAEITQNKGSSKPTTNGHAKHHAKQLQANGSKPQYDLNDPLIKKFAANIDDSALEKTLAGMKSIPKTISLPTTAPAASESKEVPAKRKQNESSGKPKSAHKKSKS